MAEKITRAPQLFEDFKIRRHFNKEQEKWFFSVIDIVAVLTEQHNYKKAKSYWSTLKERLNKENSQLVTNCDQLKLPAADGKKYLTDVADTQTLFRIIRHLQLMVNYGRSVGILKKLVVLLDAKILMNAGIKLVIKFLKCQIKMVDC